MASIGSINGLIRILYDGRGIGQAGRDTDTFAQKAQRAGNAAGAAGAGIAAGLAVAVTMAAKFEKSISGIGAVSGASADQMEKIRAKALQLGEDTAFGATEASEAMAELAKSGLTVDDILGGAADATVALAAAGGVDLPKAAAIASNAMNQFTNVAAKDLPHVADVIAGAANASAISVHDFGMSLSQVGAIANLVGFSFEDTASAIALLGNAGIKGSDAGTSLKTMFINLVPQTKPAIQLFEELGLSQFNTARAMDLLRKNGIKPVGKDMQSLNKQIVALSVKQSGSAVGTAKQTKAYAELAASTGVMSNQFFDAQGKVKPMAEVFGLIQNATKNMGEEQKIAALSTIFGTDAIRSAAIAAELGKGNFAGMSAEIAKISANDVAAKRLDNLAGDIEKLKGSAETMAINLGTVLIPALRDLAQSAADLVGKFNNLDPSTQSNIVSFAMWTAGILLVIAIIVKLVALIGAFIGIVKSLAAGIQFLTAVVRLNGSMALLMARGWITASLAWVRATAAAARARVATLAHAAATRISAAASAVWTAITTALSLANIRAAASWVISTAAMVAHRAAMIAGAVATGIMTAAQAALSAVMALNPFTLVVIAIVALVAALILAYKKSETFRAIVDAVFKYLKTFITTAITQIKTVIVAVWSFIANAFKIYFNIYKTIAVTVWNFISGVIKNNIALVKAVISAAVNFIKARWEALKALVGIVTTAFSAIVAAIKGRIAAVIAAVTGIVTGVVGKIRGMRDALVQAGRDAIQGLINGIGNMVGAVMDKARSLADGVKNTIKNALKISSPSRVMMELGVDTAQGFADGIASLQKKVAAASMTVGMVPQAVAMGSVSPTAGLIGVGGGGNTSTVTNGPGVVLERGAVQVTALPGMSPGQLGDHTARRLSTALTTRTSGPRLAVGGAS